MSRQLLFLFSCGLFYGRRRCEDFQNYIDLLEDFKDNSVGNDDYVDGRAGVSIVLVHTWNIKCCPYPARQDLLK